MIDERSRDAACSVCSVCFADVFIRKQIRNHKSEIINQTPSGPSLIAFSMMRISIARNKVKMATKRKKVVCTAPTLTLDTAALVGRRSWMTHG